MPLIGLGTYKLQSSDAIKTALDLGYRHFDCASLFHKSFLDDLFRTVCGWSICHAYTCCKICSYDDGRGTVAGVLGCECT